jgi:hypothetical protein
MTPMQRDLFGDLAPAATGPGAYGAKRLPPSFHAVDPEPSRLAADAMEASGDRARHMRLVRGMVRRLPDLTACELYGCATPAEAAELKEVQEVRRRLTDLQALGEVERSGQRACAIRGTTQSTWRATEGGESR